MPPPEMLAYPLLLGAIYGVYRIGRAPDPSRLGAFEWVRLLALAVGLGVVVLLQVRLAQLHPLSLPALAAGVLSVVGVLGLVGLHAAAVAEAWNRRRAGAGPG